MKATENPPETNIKEGDFFCSLCGSFDEEEKCLPKHHGKILFLFHFEEQRRKQFLSNNYFSKKGSLRKLLGGHYAMFVMAMITTGTKIAQKHKVTQEVKFFVSPTIFLSSRKKKN